eukprot:scaffold449_cov241-Pinguiococcus_pyrenoidosus.AAC.5
MRREVVPMIRAHEVIKQSVLEVVAAVHDTRRSGRQTRRDCAANQEPGTLAMEKQPRRALRHRIEFQKRRRPRRGSR